VSKKGSGIDSKDGINQTKIEALSRDKDFVLLAKT
jgi:hypothetical protein